jgi:uncharacterized repeat protein (TIGR03803 family)
MVKLSFMKTACLMFLVCAAAIAPAQTFQTLVNFSKTNGELAPYSPLIQGADGNLYGTTGGFVGPDSYGMAYRMTPAGDLSTLYNFCSQKGCGDGAFPSDGVIQAGNGNFYGVTYRGGALDAGIIYELTPAGKLTTMHSFCSQTNCTDGELPIGGLIQASNGNFYGTTHVGGANGTAGNYGTIFEITPSRQFTTLYSFCSKANCADGQSPYASLVQASNGNLYGTTVYGGASSYCADQSVGCGTVFEITPAGKFTTLYSFCSQPNCADGFYPFSGLMQASNGNLYGTTELGGTTGNYGTVFEITTSGKLTTLYSFCAQTSCADGEFPSSGLVQGTNGSLYGTTGQGGANCYPIFCGTAYEITPAGKLTTLHTFHPALEGINPSGMMQATGGTLYGVTLEGGNSSACGSAGCGTVFSLSK